MIELRGGPFDGHQITAPDTKFVSIPFLMANDPGLFMDTGKQVNVKRAIYELQQDGNLRRFYRFLRLEQL